MNKTFCLYNGQGDDCVKERVLFMCMLMRVKKRKYSLNVREL